MVTVCYPVILLISYTFRTLYLAVLNHSEELARTLSVGGLGLARRNLGTTPGGAVSHIRVGHFRVTPQVGPGLSGTFLKCLQ